MIYRTRENSSQSVADAVPHIADSVRAFAVARGDYYARVMIRIQSHAGFVATFNWGAAVFGPVWAAARGLWGLFWCFAVLELMALVQLSQGLFSDLGAVPRARADRLGENYERVLARVQAARDRGDETGADALARNAERLQAALEKALDQAQEAAAAGVELVIFGFFAFVLIKGIEGISANHAYEKLYSRWRADKRVCAGFQWTGVAIGAVFVAAVYSTALYGFTVAEPVAFVHTFPADKTHYQVLAAAIDRVFDQTATDFGVFFAGIARGIRFLLDGLEVIFVQTPWPVVMVVITIFAWRLAGPRVAVFTVTALAYIALLGFWEKAMETVSLLGAASFLCVAIGIPLGVWFARSERVYAGARPVLDLMQTLPSFVYLIPIIAFFGTGKPPGILASMVFGLPPIIRLTALGLREVPKDVTEASRAFGATRWQTLTGVEMPLALPSIMTGINQTILMCLSLVVIAALIGAEGLGYDILVALQYAAKGQGILAGFAILFCAVVIDRLVQGGIKREKGPR